MAVPNQEFDNLPVQSLPDMQNIYIDPSIFWKAELDTMPNEVLLNHPRVKTYFDFWAQLQTPLPHYQGRTMATYLIEMNSQFNSISQQLKQKSEELQAKEKELEKVYQTLLDFSRSAEGQRVIALEAEIKRLHGLLTNNSKTNEPPPAAVDQTGNQAVQQINTTTSVTPVEPTAQTGTKRPAPSQPNEAAKTTKRRKRDDSLPPLPRLTPTPPPGERRSTKHKNNAKKSTLIRDNKAGRMNAGYDHSKTKKERDMEKAQFEAAEKERERRIWEDPQTGFQSQYQESLERNQGDEHVQHVLQSLSEARANEKAKQDTKAVSKKQRNPKPIISKPINPSSGISAPSQKPKNAFSSLLTSKSTDRIRKWEKLAQEQAKTSKPTTPKSTVHNPSQTHVIEIESDTDEENEDLFGRSTSRSPALIIEDDPSMGVCRTAPTEQFAENDDNDDDDELTTDLQEALAEDRRLQEEEGNFDDDSEDEDEAEDEDETDKMTIELIQAAIAEENERQKAQELLDNSDDEEDEDEGCDDNDDDDDDEDDNDLNNDQSTTHAMTTQAMNGAGKQIPQYVDESEESEEE